MKKIYGKVSCNNGIRSLFKAVSRYHEIRRSPLFSPLLIRLGDEIAEPRPGMNIKVAAFTVSEKSSNTIRNTESESFEECYQIYSPYRNSVNNVFLF